MRLENEKGVRLDPNTCFSSSHLEDFAVVVAHWVGLGPPTAPEQRPEPPERTHFNARRQGAKKGPSSEDATGRVHLVDLFKRK